MLGKRQLQMRSSHSFKFFEQHASFCHNNQRQRYSFKNENNINNNIQRTLKKKKESQIQDQPKNEENVLLEKNVNGEHKKIMLSKGTIQQSLLVRLKKLGYVSNPVSKPSSPSTKKKQIDSKTHRKNISNVSSIDQKTSDYLSNTLKQTQKYMGKNNFNYKHVIGKGGFGKVWKVEMKKAKKIYAMKQMSKALVISKKSVPSVMNQKKLLSELKNPFLVNMIHSFQDRETLYLVMDYLPGGDLRHHIAIKRRFSQEEAKFIISCILLGLKYLHHNNIIHRDIKPQNLVLDAQGYIRITDLGIAREYRPNNEQDTSGTPGYMAPQVLCRYSHTYSVDFFALGVIAYELMLRKRPYNGRSRKQIRDQIVSRQIQIKRQEIPDNWSMQAADFVNRLIQRKPSNRLGYSGPQQIMNHPWLRKFPFDKLAQRQIKAPFVPDASLANQQFEQGNISEQQTQMRELVHQNQILLRNPDVQKLFQGYQNNNKL